MASHKPLVNASHDVPQRIGIGWIGCTQLETFVAPLTGAGHSKEITANGSKALYFALEGKAGGHVVPEPGSKRNAFR